MIPGKTRRLVLLLAGTALALGSTGLALAAPEDLLPPSFGNPPPEPAPAPAPAPTPGAAAPRPTAPVPGPGGGGVVQPIPGGSAIPSAPAGPVQIGGITLPADFPSLAQLEAMDPEEVDE